MYNNKIMNDEINKIISQHKQGLYHEALGNIKSTDAKQLVYLPLQPLMGLQILN